MTLHRRSLLLTTSFLLAGACASPSQDYPSLAIRDAERLVGSPTEAAAPAPPAPITADILAQTNSLAEKARQSHASFTARAGIFGPRIEAASGAAVASDRWSDAQILLSQLDSLRASTAIALADLDVLHTSRAVELQRRDAIDAARADVAALLAEEDRTLARLKAMLRQ